MPTATLAAEKIFTVGAVGQDAIKYRLWKHATSTTAANKYAEGTLAGNPDPLTQNQFYRLPANQIVITQLSGTVMTDAFVTDELKGALGRDTWVELFSDAAGGAFTTNRVAVAAADWAFA